jgi:hypothetical protein
MGAAYAGIQRRADQSQFPHTRLNSMEIESVRFEPVFRPITSRRENPVPQREEELDAVTATAPITLRRRVISARFRVMDPPGFG